MFVCLNPNLTVQRSEKKWTRIRVDPHLWAQNFNCVFNCDVCSCRLSSRVSVLQFRFPSLNRHDIFFRHCRPGVVHWWGSFIVLKYLNSIYVGRFVHKVHCTEIVVRFPVRNQYVDVCHIFVGFERQSEYKIWTVFDVMSMIHSVFLFHVLC